MRLPGLLARLDDHGREIFAELIRVDLKPAMLGTLEREGEGRKFLMRAEPDEAALAHIDVGFEHRGVARALYAVDAVGGDDEIRVAHIGRRIHLAAVGLLDAEPGGPFLKNIEQALALDA